MSDNHTFKPFQTLMYGIGGPSDPTVTPIPQSEIEKEFIGMPRTPIVHIDNNRLNALDERMNNTDSRINVIDEKIEWLKTKLSNIVEELVDIKISINKLSQRR